MPANARHMAGIFSAFFDRQVAKLVFIAVIISIVVWIFASYNGLSWTVVIVAVLVLIYNFLMTKTTLGRHIYGVGGNPEATELSGISVSKISLDKGLWHKSIKFKTGTSL